MATAKKTTTAKAAPTAPTGGTDLDKCIADLKAAGLESDVFEYRHAYVDVMWKDEQGDRQKREFRPDGSELLRDPYGVEVTE